MLKNAPNFQTSRMKGATLRTGESPTKTMVMAEEVDTTTIEITTGAMAEDTSHREEVTETVVDTGIIEEGAAATMTPEKEAGENQATIMEETTIRTTATMAEIKSKAQVGAEAQSREVDMAALTSDQELRKVLLAMPLSWGTRPKGVARALTSTLAT